MIPVTKPYLPSREKLDAYIDGIYERSWLTNNGPLLKELTKKLEEYLGVENILLVSNGTLALQVAYKTLGISNTGCTENAEAITTPFTFVATASSLQWEGVKPVFTDISADSWCLDPANIESAITEKTRAIVPVHVFGNACDVEAIDQIAEKHQLKVVYDASHAFAVNYKGNSLLNWGDAATLSLHATKLFHTIEGGAIVFKHKADLERAQQIINFGLAGPEDISGPGINAKMNEFQAAMGLCVLDEMETITNNRKQIGQSYQRELRGRVVFQKWNKHGESNHAYAPVLFESETELLAVEAKLKENNIFSRRYFYPSLDNLEHFKSEQVCANSRDIASRILCLPLFPNMTDEERSKVIKVLMK
ncbi:DegT/DnrJ/EryC1/StrS family aminotransferase [Bermanella marisrubri]|uniref:Sugar transamine/perosamine synthetase n=1 Tax=Bermanella marisrubri TaxID=207949 RepID=Q1N5B4_9GAMM|nr:DegT/DnrJ/EryC1/StrS family aminotransferase [Bermanella marisrubri]EAT13134.1 sugar transamine/perosamine synthetase [Oceanobacter sp. RED65] [Bermanella marisrubri]QIZ83911.1 DegT/DnrJ/EryC1/StrS family aminotransferase [Bermanella marisrubri]